MKSKVKFSVYCIVVTIAVSALLVAVVIMNRDKGGEMEAIAAITGFILLFGLFYCPVSIETSDSGLIIRRVLKSKTIPYPEISSVDRCYPSAGGLRLCGSGGCLGYWGYFSDIIIGTYFGYYGDRDQCILIKLKSGRQYVVSCKQPDAMAAAIASRL